ncbi:MAG: Flp1 family type IVb pilin [Eubacteriales bacterium]
MLKMLRSKRGMEMVQVGILIAIAIGVGLLFKTHITNFVEKIFSGLMSAGF